MPDDWIAEAASPAAQPLTVTQLTAALKGVVQECFPSVWVAGEISNLARPRSGHLYLTLKDSGAQLRAVMWSSSAGRLPFQLQEGQAVIAQGSLEVYAPQGSYQLIIRKIEPQGVGALQLAFEQLKQRLANEGLFDAQRKRSLPRFPQRIAVVTSPSGAAVRDFLQIALRRWPQAQITVVPCKVQGVGAAASIASAIADAHRLQPPPDVIVATRGGGSQEDLWCFNEEPAVRAIAASRLPIVSAVGHEIDVTLADFAADVRALTPSEAAELVVPEVALIAASLQQMRQRMATPIRQRIAAHQQQLRQLASRPALANPLAIVQDRARRLDELDFRGRRAIWSSWRLARQQTQQAAASLTALSPLQVLARGYSVTQHEDRRSVIRSVDQVQPGQPLVTQLSDGSLISIVQRVQPQAEVAATQPPLSEPPHPEPPHSQPPGESAS